MIGPTRVVAGILAFLPGVSRAQDLEVPRLVPLDGHAWGAIQRPGGAVHALVRLDHRSGVYVEPLRVPQAAGYAVLPGDAESESTSPFSQDAGTAGVLRIEERGKLVTQLFHGADQPRPYFHPVTMPDGTRLTRSWPMEEGPDEVHDHPHHRGLWFTFGDVNGIDFWSESARAGKIRQTSWDGRVTGVFSAVVTRNEWVAPDGAIVCRDTRTFVLYDTRGARLFDYAITIHASEGDVTFGDTKEGMMAIRLAPTLRLKGPVATGSIVNAAGDRDGATWGKRAAWCHYAGTVGAKRYGIAIFDHPENLRHPTWWHVRDYGLFAANPFGLRHFEPGPGRRGEHGVAKGASLTFRYRFLLHEGDLPPETLDRVHADWAANTVRLPGEDR